jgi:ferritin-like metal-binding protein YciE
MSQTKLETPTDLLRFQLRTAFTMEEDSLAALGELAQAAKSADVKKLFRHHADETKEQIEILRRVFGVLDFPVSTAASPSTKGISKQAKSLIDRSAPALRDQVTLSAALGNEHYEISAYESLILATRSIGAADAVALLQQNLDQEVHTSQELNTRLSTMTG